MDTEAVKAEFAGLSQQIQTLDKADRSPEGELQRRKLWRDLEVLRMDIADSTRKVTDESKEQIEASSVELSKMLSLKPFTKRPNPVLGGVRFLAFFFMTTMMFSVFVAAFPLRLMHPFLRKLGLKNNNLPYDYVTRLWGAWAMLIFGIRCKIEGWENVDKFYRSGTSTIGLFQHSSFLDFIVVMGACGYQFKWVSKKSLYRIPMLGLMGYMAGMIPIDRTNLDSAKKSLDNAAYVAQHYGRGVAIAPEGTRSMHGQLAEFKKGAFHLSLKCDVDATPLLLFGAYNLWSPSSFFPSTGQLTLRLLPALSIKKYQPDRYNAMLKDTRLAMLEAMANPPQPLVTPISTFYNIASLACTAVTYALTAGAGYGIWKLFH